MKRLLILCLVTASTLFAWEDPSPISEETKLKYADWAGSGSLQKKNYVGKLDGAHVWKTSLVVSEITKGEMKKEMDFYFEQGISPHTKSTTVRRPGYPKVPDLQSATIYLHKRILDGKEVYFLNGRQMIKITTLIHAIEPIPQ